MLKEQETIFGTPNYLSNDNNNEETFGLPFTSEKNISDIYNILDNASFEDLSNIKIKYNIDNEIIENYKIIKDIKLNKYLSNEDYESFYSRLKELNVINIENIYKKHLRLLTGQEEPTPEPQSLVITVPVLALGFTYVLTAYTAFYIAIAYLQISGPKIKEFNGKLEFITNFDNNLKFILDNILQRDNEKISENAINYLLKNIIKDMRSYLSIQQQNQKLLRGGV